MAGEAMQQSIPAAASERFNLEGVERLIVRSDPTIKSYIPFGIEGTSVIISPYGEILRMSQYVDEEDPRIICLASPSLEYYQRDLAGVGNFLHLQAQVPGTGLGVHLESASGDKEPSFETRLEWLNGHWPYIYYEFNGLAISVAFTVERGVLSQQYVLVNPSEKDIDIRFDLQVGQSEVYTLYVDGTQWAGYPDSELSQEQPSILPGSSGSFHIAERDLRTSQESSPQNDNHPRSFVRGEAVIAVFRNGTLVVPEKTFPISTPHSKFYVRDEDSDDESENGGTPLLNPSKTLRIKPKGAEKLVVQYKLQNHGSQDSTVLEDLSADKILKGNRSRIWFLEQNDILNSIFRRHLEHILCVCLVNILPKSDQQRRVAFINDFTFEAGSTPVNDFYIFRYLLFMYQVLETDEHIRPIPDSTNQDTRKSNFEKRMLQDRIKEACGGHLLWCFEKDVLLASQSWPLSKVEDDTDPSDSICSRQPFLGSLQMLKLFEYARVFNKEAKIVDRCLRSGAELWLDALTRNRDEKSKLWYGDTKQVHVAWEGHRGERSEWLHLPKYRLRDLICIWKALKGLEELMLCSSDEGFATEISKKLKKSELRHYDVRKIILKHFLCEDFKAGAPRIADQSAPTDFGKTSERTEPFTGSFAIAVRRTRERDRLLLYATDAMLHDGFEWGFFKDDVDIEILSTREKITKADVQISWKNTVGAQGADREAIWEKPLKYALAITMARYGSLDKTMSSEELEKLSWDRLFDCVAPCGLFVNSTKHDTKRSERIYLDCSQRSPWEIPTLLLRKRFENLEVAFFRDPPQISSPPKQNESVSNEHDAPQLSDSIASQDANNAMKKRVYLEKQRMRTNKTPDMNMVSDLRERKSKEWLYPLPDFLSQRPPYGPIQEEVKRLERRLGVNLNDRTGDGLRENLDIFLKRGVERWRASKDWRGESEDFSTYPCNAILVSIGKHTRNEPSIDLCDAKELNSELCQARTKEKAKKRFHYLEPLRVEQVLILYLATPIHDRRNMEQFCIRHASFSSHFHEDVHPLADVWATELHLGFLQLVDMQEKTGDTRYLDSDNVCNGRQRKFPHIVKDLQFDIYKASLGYRFVGDMGDRYWSGWLLSYVPRESTTLGHADETNIWQWFDRKIKNDQRRILEPYLVGNMVAEVYQSTDKILRYVDQWLDPEIEFPSDKEGSKESNISPADDQNFGLQYNRSTTCLELESILSMLRRLSKANVDSLHHWNEREKSRHYRPRWSEKDELNHREQVDHQKRRAEQQIFLLTDQHRQIETCIDQLRAHRQELMDNLNLTQSRTAALNAENVRIFTYATVIFYPLSFVASLFSVQGPPKYSVTVSLIQATAIALVITLVIVFNAEILAWPFRRLRFSISITAREKMGETSNVFPVPWRKTLRRIKEAEEQDVLHDIEMPKWPRSKLIYFMFLMIYLAVEFPASRIVLAYNSVMKNGARTPENVALTAVQILIAITMLPLFVVTWIVLVIWSILHSFLSKIWAVQELQKKMGQELLDAAVKEYVDAEEETKEQDGEKEIDRKGAPVTAHEEKSNKKKKREPPKTVGERKKELKKKVEKARRNASKEREDRLQEHVKLLINPPKLYEAKVKGFTSRTKSGEDNKSAITRTSTATSSSGKDEGNLVTPKQMDASEDQSLTHRSIWRIARRLKKNAIDEEVKVAGRQPNTAKHTQSR